MFAVALKGSLYAFGYNSGIDSFPNSWCSRSLWVDFMVTERWIMLGWNTSAWRRVSGILFTCDGTLNAPVAFRGTLIVSPGNTAHLWPLDTTSLPTQTGIWVSLSFFLPSTKLPCPQTQWFHLRAHSWVGVDINNDASTQSHFCHFSGRSRVQKPWAILCTF